MTRDLTGRHDWIEDSHRGLWCRCCGARVEAGSPWRWLACPPKAKDALAVLALTAVMWAVPLAFGAALALAGLAVIRWLSP